MIAYRAFCDKVGYTFDPAYSTDTCLPLFYCDFVVAVIGLSVKGEGVSKAIALEDAASKALFLLRDTGLLDLKGARLRVRLKDGYDYELPKSKISLLLEGGGTSLEIDGQALSNLMSLIAEDPSAVDGYCSNKLLDEIPFMSVNELKDILLCIGIGGFGEVFLVKPPSARFASFLIMIILANLDGHPTDEQQLAIARIFEMCLFFWHSNVPGLSNSICRVLAFLQKNKQLPFIMKARCESFLMHSTGFWEKIPKFHQQPPRDLATSSSPGIDPAVLAEFHKINDSVIRPLFGVSAELYGSSVNGFSLPGSDVDAVVLLGDGAEGADGVGSSVLLAASRSKEDQPGEETHSDPLDVPFDLLPYGDFEERELVVLVQREIEKKFPGRYRMEAVENARVPILVIRSFDKRPDGELGGPPDSLEINISFNHPVVLANSQLLRSYADLHPKLKETVIAVKRWAKARKVCDALAGSLSSYSWTLLVISHFQAFQLLPNLQSNCSQLSFLDWQQKGLSAIEVLGEEAFEIWEQTSIESLLFRFFAYYNSEFDFYGQVVRIKGERMSKVSGDSGIPIALLKRRLWLCIEDPFEIDRYLGTSAKGLEIIFIEMRRAISLIKANRFQSLFDPFEGRRKPSDRGNWSFPTLWLAENPKIDVYAEFIKGNHFDNICRATVKGSAPTEVKAVKEALQKEDNKLTADELTEAMRMIGVVAKRSNKTVQKPDNNKLSAPQLDDKSKSSRRRSEARRYHQKP